jgi:VIT1/CCC1 family predicted Fe2+/Mn2+ transporter
MAIVSLKNSIVKAFQGESNDSSQSKQLISSDTPSYHATDDRAGDLGHAEEDIQTVDSDSLKDFSNKNFDDEHNHSSILGLLGKIDPRVMSDMIIGLSDGLTVPFALTAGLSSLGDTKLVITGGFAELISGAISMGLGGYLAAKSESDFYKSEYKSEKQKLYSNITEVNHEVEDILLDINQDFSEETIVSFIKDLKKNPKLMLEFVIRFGKGLEEPAENRQLTSALTIGSAYFFGGFIPLIPYFFVNHVDTGLFISIVIMAFTLFIFGYVKATMSLGEQCSKSQKVFEAVQMVLVGGSAAGSAWFLVKMIG